MDNNKSTLIKKIIAIIWNVIYSIVIIICIILIFVIVMQRITNSNKSIRGLRLFRVISGSMVPQYDVGQVVVCKDINIKDLKIGDTIVYRGDKGQFEGKIIMHNIVSIKTNDKGEIILVTQGLYNTVGDPEITEKQIYGKVIAKAYILTILYDLSNNIYTFFVIIVILVLNVFISWKKPKIIEIEKEEVNKEEVEKESTNVELENDKEGNE